MFLSAAVRRFSDVFLARKIRKSKIERQVAHLKKFVSYHPTSGSPPTRAADMNRLDITWVIPDFMPGAGGHMTIFRIASHLEKFGHNVRFLVQNPSVHKTGAEARKTINEHFQPFSER